MVRRCKRQHAADLLAAMLMLTACGDDDAGSGATDGTETGATGTGGTDPTTTGLSTGGEQTSTGQSTGTTTAATTEDSGTTAIPNTDPAPQGDRFFAFEDRPLIVGATEGLLVNDSDDDDDPLTVVDFDAASAQGGSVVVAGNGAFSYIPPEDFCGSDSFQYTVSDGAGGMGTTTVNVWTAPSQLSSVAGTCGYTIGLSLGSVFGIAVSGVPDMNGDSYDEVISVDGNDRVYVVWGRADFTSVDAGELDGAGFVITGPGVDDAVGVPDMNDDGLPDIAVQGNGLLYVVFGKSDTDPVDLDEVEAGNGGFAVTDSDGLYSLSPVESAGDVNGDGLGDVLVGTSGEVVVVFGKTDTDPLDFGAIRSGDGGGFAVDTPVDVFSMSTAGDVNGDGFADLLLASSEELPGGVVRVVFGKDDADPVDASDLGDGGYEIIGEAGTVAGYAVASVGDMNGDGVEDHAISAPLHGDDAGRIYIVYGKDSDTAAIALADVAQGEGGFVVEGAAGEYSGLRLHGAGDINGDGFPDVMVGNWFVGQYAGESAVVFGKDDGDRVRLADLDAGMGGFRSRGDAVEQYSGFSIATADVNGDGTEDLVIGQPGENDLEGRVIVIVGPTNPS